MRASLTLSRVSAFQMLANCFVSRCWLLFYHVPDDAGGGCRDAKLKHAAQELESQQKRCMYYSAKVGKTVYHVFDASKMPLGRMCQQISLFIRGKHKPIYRYSRGDLGDQCIVVNAQDILLTGKKALKKNVIYHTGFVGNLKIIPYSKFLLEKPEQLIFWIVWKQLPRNNLRRHLLQNLKVYRDAAHDIPELPNFVPAPPEFDFMKKHDPVKIFTSKHAYLKFTNVPENQLPEEAKYLKIQLDKEIEIPLKERKYIFKMTPHNKMVLAQWKRYQKLKKRQRIFKPKKPRHNKLLDGPQIIKKQKYFKKLGLDKIQETEPEIEDESLTRNVF